MTGLIQARVTQLLAADPACRGVKQATIRALAVEFAREAEPDRDVLAERAACVAVLTAGQARLTALALAHHDGANGSEMAALLGLELRRSTEAIEMVRQGLHRTTTGAI